MQVSTKTSTTKDRILEIGKIWATIGLFHPRLSDQDKKFLGAFARAKERAEKSATVLEHRQNVEMMLDELSDPSTYVLPPPDVQIETVAVPDRIAVSNVDVHIDGAVIISVRDTFNPETFRSRVRAITNAKLIVDLRRFDPPFGDKQKSLDMLLQDCFCTKDVQAPIRRSKYYSGYPAEIDDWGYFYSGWCTRSAETFRKSDFACTIKPCLLIDYQTSVSILMLAMHDAGLVSIVSCGPVFVDSNFHSTIIECGGDLKVMLRLEDYLFSSGRIQFEPDKSFDSEEFQDVQKLFEAITVWLNDDRQSPSSSLASAGSKIHSDAFQETYDCSSLSSTEMLSSLFRIWVIVRYFFPYLSLMTDNWDSVIDAAYESFDTASNCTEFARAVTRVVAHLNDSHVSVISVSPDSFDLAAPPFLCRIVDSRPTVVQLLNSDSRNPAVGACIVAIDGVPAQSRLDALSEICAASSLQSLNEIVSERLLAGGAFSEMNVTVENLEGEVETVTLMREPQYRFARILPSNAINSPFEKLDDRLGYVDLTQLEPDMIDEMFELMLNTDALIFDMRGYPLGTFEIASRLSMKPVPALNFIRPYVRRPYQSYYIYDRSEPIVEVFSQDVCPSTRPRYRGKTAMLIDGRTISQAEKMAMLFKAANGTCLIGEPSAGTNGTVTNFTVAGGLQVTFTGEAITHPDGRQTQRLGLQPDILVRPNIKCIRSGVDAALDVAISHMRPTIKQGA